MNNYTASPCAYRLAYTDHPDCRVRPSAGYRTDNEPLGKRQRVSHCNDLQRLTLTESAAPGCQPVKGNERTARAVQPSQPARAVLGNSALHTALHNLSNNILSTADFITLVNRFGYHPSVHSFPLDLLQPSDWLALKERACQQILLEHGSLLPKLPPQAVTCHTCMAAYRHIRKRVFELVPEHLKEAFFTNVVQSSPMAALSIPSKEQTPERLLHACCSRRWMLAQLPADKRSVDLATEVCRRTGYGLEYIPEQERSYDLCLKACKTRGDALEHVPEHLKSDEICQVALSTYGSAYRWLPEKLSQSDDWQLRACKKDGTVLQWIAKEHHDEDLLEAACSSRWQALALIEPHRITYEMCRLACSHKENQAYQHVPDHHMDDDLRELICCTTSDPLICARFSLNTAKFYEKLLQENLQASLEWVPETSRTHNHCLLACQKRGKYLQFAPFEHRTAEVCLAACRNHSLAIQWVPVELRTPEICQAACKEPKHTLQYVPKGALPLQWFIKKMYDYNSAADEFLAHARRLLPAAEFQLLLEGSVLCDDCYKVAMLTHPQVSAAQKDELITWIMQPRSWPTAALPKDFDLCEMASPLPFSMENPELKHLKWAAVQAAGNWAVPHHHAGIQILDEIEQALCCATVEQADHSEPLFHTQGVPAGGRALKIDQGEQAYYYKFQRKGESLKTLMQEGIIHTVRKNHPDLFGELRSKLPGDACFFRLYLNEMPTTQPKLTDPLAIQRDESGRDYVHVYRYKASAEYCVYAHRTDHSNPCRPWQKGEQGILAACHDIGRFVGLGLVPTSTLPAFHDSATGREWIALHALLGYGRQTVYPGTFGAWNSLATEHCDFGYDGFRDVGDFEPFGQIESFMNRHEALGSLQMPELEQCLCLVNAVCENLLAAHLIRARLRQQGADYHYKNPTALQQTETFIEQTLLSFLQGMYADRIESPCERSFLRKWLGLGANGYDEWLSRAAVEILYWTARQPHPEHPLEPPFKDCSSRYSHEDGYALHMNRTGRLDPDLYPDGEVKEVGAPAYPCDFHTTSGRLNLGRNNSVFPLTTLMRGLVRLCTGILAYDHSAMALSFESRQPGPTVLRQQPIEPDLGDKQKEDQYGRLSTLNLHHQNIG